MNSSNVFIVSQHLQVATLAKTKNNNLQSSSIKAAVVSDSGTRVQAAWAACVGTKCPGKAGQETVERLTCATVAVCTAQLMYIALRLASQLGPRLQVASLFWSCPSTDWMILQNCIGLWPLVEAETSCKVSRCPHALAVSSFSSFRCGEC